MNKKEITTPYFQVSLFEDAEWVKLNRPNENAYRIRFIQENQKYEIDMIAMEANLGSAQELAKKKFDTNQHSGFSNENIPPFQYPKQNAGLVAWGCRYRWVDGGAAPYRFQEAFIEIDDKVIHLSYGAEPETFDPGLVVFNEIVNSLKPVTNS